MAYRGQANLVCRRSFPRMPGLATWLKFGSTGSAPATTKRRPDPSSSEDARDSLLEATWTPSVSCAFLL